MKVRRTSADCHSTTSWGTRAAALPVDNALPFGNNNAMGEAAGAVVRLRARLRALGWTQRELAAALETSPAIVCRILSGERKPSLDLAFRIQKSRVAIPADAWVTHSPSDESGEHVAVDVTPPRSSTG